MLTKFRFHAFFAQVENYKEPHFLYLSTRGITAAKNTPRTTTKIDPTRKQRKDTLKRSRSGSYKQVPATDEDSAIAVEESIDAQGAILKEEVSSTARPEGTEQTPSEQVVPDKV